jgi:hypothetical protein
MCEEKHIKVIRFLEEVSPMEHILCYTHQSKHAYLFSLSVLGTVKFFNFWIIFSLYIYTLLPKLNSYIPKYIPNIFSNLATRVLKFIDSTRKPEILNLNAP